MGYYEARITGSRFTIAPEREAAALERLLEVSRDDFGYDLADRELTDLEGFLRLFEVGVERDDEGRIVGLRFDAQLLLETEDVFQALGPYAEAGSYVRVHSGTGARWRYDYDGTSTTRVDEPDEPWDGR